MKKGFSLLEILMVLGIISLLVTIGSTVYSFSQRKSRDAKRVSDLAIVKDALELYRSNNNVYPSSYSLACTGTTSLTDGNNVLYLNTPPKDPKCPSQYYVYTYDSTTGEYTLGALLETKSTTASCGNCATGKACNYCAGPYGQK